MNVTPLYDRIFFRFTENLTNSNFMPKTKSGIFISDNYDFSEVHRPKWGEVLKCGPNTSDDIKNSKYILIEPAKWTTRIEVDGITFWQTEEKFILAVTDDEGSTYRYG